MMIETMGKGGLGCEWGDPCREVGKIGLENRVEG